MVTFDRIVSTNKIIYEGMHSFHNTDSRNQDQRPGRPNAMNRNPQQSTRPPACGVFRAKATTLDLKTLKEKNSTEVVHKLNEGMAQLKFLLRSQEDQHNSDDFIYDLICTLAKACRAPSGENTNKILAALKGSVFFNKKIPSLLDRVQASIALNDQVCRQRLIQCLIEVFTKYLTHLPSSYVDLPYVQLKTALHQSSIERKKELQKELDTFKQARDDIIRGERQKHGKRFINKVGEKPPNDFREIPICPTNKEITTQERPFLRKNISKGRYENAEHYLDVQFRLLREDFLEPLREGIHEIVLNVPRHQRKQLMKNYRSVRIVGRQFTWSGIIHQVQIDVSGLDTSRWAHSKRLLFGSFVCLSKDNFKTMLFATVSNREPEKVKRGRIDIRFIEEQDVLGIESRNCVYQMVESPAYFEAYRHVLKGLKELDETTLPFKKYLVECSEDVDPPEYLRRSDTEEPVCYNLNKALDVSGASNATAVPVLLPEAWPSVKTLPLNDSQLDALRTAITTEFSVIQGPPGTGKTYVGAKIVRCLLENRRAWDPQSISPMLMVCYTNHALDQFLEKVLEFLPRRKIIRVGGRCKSESLEACNLKKFTYRYKLHEKRDEVDNKMRQNDREMTKWKEELAKADRQPLEFKDVEELLNPSHLQQLCNAKFPCNVANESRTPENTFKLWLCNNKLVGSCNQTAEVSIHGKRDANDDELFFDSALFAAPQDGDENKPFTCATQHPFPAVDALNGASKTRFEPTLVVLEHKELKENSYDCKLPSDWSAKESSNSLKDQPFSNTSKANVELNCTAGENVELTEVADSIKETENPQTENKLGDEKVDDVSEADEETIAIEREADLIQHQRLIQGEEDLLLPISEQTGDLVNQLQEQGWRNEENDDGFILVTNTKKGKSHFWRKADGENVKWDDKDVGIGEAKNKDEGAKTNSSKKNKKRNKKKKKIENPKIIVTGDISFLDKELKKKEMMSIKEAMGVENIWNLSQSDRLRMYLFWTENYRERYRVEIFRGEQEYEQLCEELEAVRFEEEEQVIRQATVVGMTTSGAARYHSMLQRIAPKIVVIEEAAEVMEAHIITSLSHNTKHTILIGDHKQLRPKATVYELAQKYNLEVSLFERMVMNSMDCKRLSIQHRMRPEIAALTKRIYDHEIIDHESVCHFPDISGVCHNLFFIDHCQPENLVGGLQSYSNHHEAEFLVALCKYLLLQGYDRNQITILTMYTGQLLLLQDKMPRRAFQGVKVCAVDNFQGEENDIILLSLVRSNSEGRIGFLGESNRICVALSRARQGFYCIGNFSLLKNQSKLFKKICDDLKTKEAIGDSLQLVCKRHKNVTSVRRASDFKHNQLGGCTMPCGVRLECGHACDMLCHASDVYHKEGHCPKLCSISCPYNHKCPRKCHYPNNCAPCSVPVLKTPCCGHEQPVACSIDPDMSPRFKCEEMVTKTLPCGHEKRMPCYKDPVLHRCTSSCTKVLECGHPCSERCHMKCQCNTRIQIQLPCKHWILVLCREKEKSITCNEKCERVLDCGHNCLGMCHEDCRRKQCNISLFKNLPCGHQQIVPCFQNPETVFCRTPCPRQLDCGHKCFSLCGRLCQEVQCEELCQRKCKEGHPCQKRCHFGSSCDGCKEEVNRTIPTCGHSINTLCYVDPVTLKCKQPCERLRICGHPCNEICSKNCEARPCQVPVSRTLSCDHVVTLACHKNPEKFICKKRVEVQLSCKHKTSLECHVEKGGLEHVLCKENVEKNLRCNHKLILPCHKNPEDCICRKIVEVELPCGHNKSVQCSTVTAGLLNVCCTVKVSRTLACNHKAILPCYIKPEDYCCQEKIEITLSCGHNKHTTCSNKWDVLKGGMCVTKVTRKLPCGHEKEVQCSDKPDQIFCDALCERFLSCEHPCPYKCGDDCASAKCAVGVKKALSCGYHKVSCLCSEDVSQLICSNQCTRKLTCGHQCPGKCSELCSQYKCKTMMVKNLNCPGNHSLKMHCKDNPNIVACQERCNKILECGHPCPGLCSQPCARMKCMREVEKRHPCGHKEHIQCFQSKTATCKAPCRRREGCKHMCKGICGEPCSKYPCPVVLGKTLPCGHKVRMPCSFSVNDAQCPAPCGEKLSCGHQCSGTCGECKQRGSHEMCQNPCNRLLVCSHRCEATCSKPCPPCERKCGGRCPHGRCTQKCLQNCNSCRKPCTWVCPHYQCKNLCGEECDRPRCDAPCPKKLACRHPCIGLCGENCPTVCAICHSKKLSSMVGDRGDKTREVTRYLQLFDCGHVVKVDEMDAWMLRERGSDVELIQCPRCSTPITFSYRYGNIIKTTLRNIQNVKAQIRELGKEKASYSSNLLKRLRHPSKKILAVVEKLSRRPRSMELDNVPMRHIPFVFTLGNNLLVKHQIEKAHDILEIVAKCQEKSKQQLQITEHLRMINDALENITEYLENPQLDLTTLNQVYEHTQKFTLFALILEAQCEAIKRQSSFSSIGETRLKMAENQLNLFVEGNNDVLRIDWLEKIVASLRKEMNFTPIPPEEPKDFENFPGFNRGVWKLCDHREVYFTRSILRDGKHVSAVSNVCRQCAETEDSDNDREGEPVGWRMIHGLKFLHDVFLRPSV